MRTLSIFLSLALLVSFGAASFGQGCATGAVVLTVTPAAPTPGAPIAITVTGTPGAYVTMFRSATLGQATVNQGPLNGTALCLAAPLTMWPLGQLPPSGTRTVNYPTGPGAAGLSYHYQAVTMVPGQPPTIDTSNTSSITFTTPPPPSCTPGAVGLSITPANPSPGQQMTVAVTGTPGAIATLFSAPATGASVLGGMGPLTGAVICLAFPFHSMPLGPIPASGTKTVTLRAPLNAVVGSTIHYQALTAVGGSPTTTPTIDTSATVPVTISPLPPPPPCTPGTVSLVITPDVPVQAGNTITTTVTGTPGAHVLMVQGKSLGASMLQNNTTLCIAAPYHVHPLGTLDASGTLTRSYVLPPFVPLTGTQVWFYQAVTATGTGATLSFDTSNTDSLTF